jgi:hypothetical protein
MNNVLKTFSVGFCLLSTQSYAASVDILTYFKPGGSTDSHIQQIKPLLEEKGFDVNVQYMKSCADALNYAQSTSSDVLMYQLTGDYNPGASEGRCVMTGKEKIKAVAIPYVGPINVCASPNKSISMNDFLGGRTLTMGVGAGGKSMEYFQKSFDALGAQIEIKKYRGGGKKNKAAIAGDVDMFSSVNQSLRKVKDHGTCFASTVRNNPLGNAFIGDLIGDPNWPEFTDGQIIWTNNPSSPVISAYNQILTSKSYIASQEKKLLRVPAESEIDSLMEMYGN